MLIDFWWTRTTVEHISWTFITFKRLYNDSQYNGYHRFGTIWNETTAISINGHKNNATHFLCFQISQTRNCDRVLQKHGCWGRPASYQIHRIFSHFFGSCPRSMVRNSGTRAPEVRMTVVLNKLTQTSCWVTCLLMVPHPRVLFLPELGVWEFEYEFYLVYTGSQFKGTYCSFVWSECSLWFVCWMTVCSPLLLRVFSVYHLYKQAFRWAQQRLHQDWSGCSMQKIPAADLKCRWLKKWFKCLSSPSRKLLCLCLGW